MYILHIYIAVHICKSKMFLKLTSRSARNGYAKKSVECLEKIYRMLYRTLNFEKYQLRKCVKRISASFIIYL